MSAKYPRTKHFPFSPGSTSDDKFMSEEDFESLVGEHLIFTEKLDGSNVCLTRDAVYSRSHSGPPGHVSFNPLKSLHSVLRQSIGNGVSVFGEWCYAVHSIRYSVLQHHLNIFGVRDDATGKWWDWESVILMTMELGVPTVPVLLEGAVANKRQLQKIIESFSRLSSVYGPIREGLVVRKFDGVYQDNEKLVGLGKWVRANHIQTDKHWTRKSVEKQPSILTLDNF